MYDGLVGASSGLELPITIGFLTMLPMQWLALLFCTGLVFEVLLEVPTGILADSLGRKFAIISSIVFGMLYCGSLLLMWWCGTQQSPQGVIFWRLVSHLLFAFSFTFYSGSFLAWVKDALDEISAGSRLTELLAKAQVLYFAMLLFGGLLGLFLWLEGLVQWAYSLALFIYALAAVILCFTMEENRQFDFAQFSDFLGKSRHKVWMDISHTWRFGARFIKKEPRLISVFATVAACNALMYLVDFIWPVFTRAHFTEKMSHGFSKEWAMLLIIAFGASLVGSFVFSKTVTYYGKRGGALDSRRLAIISAATNFFYTIPIFVAVVFSTFISTGLTLPMFMAILLIHKFSDGALPIALQSLQSELIPTETKERSTILSLGAMLKNLVILFLFFFGIGKQADSLFSWIYPAGAVVVTTVIMVLVIFLYKPSVKRG